MFQYLNNSIDTNANLKYNENLWQFHPDILSNIIDHITNDFNTIHALYLTSKIFHHSIHNIRKIIIDNNNLDIPTYKPLYYHNMTTILLKNLIFEDPKSCFMLDKNWSLLDNIINYWNCKQLELTSCQFKHNNFCKVNPFSSLEYNKTINKIYLNNVTGLDYRWIMPSIFNHEDIISEIIIDNSPDKKSDDALNTVKNLYDRLNRFETDIAKHVHYMQTDSILENFCEGLSNKSPDTKCNINKISMINCNIFENIFYFLMKMSSQTNISSIDLRNNLISKDHNNFIYYCLKSFSNLKTLNLTGNPIDIDQINIWRESNRNIEILF